MALQKTFSTKYGVDATYWKVVRLEFDWLLKQCFCRVSGWKDEASRNNSDEPLAHQTFDWQGDDFTFDHASNNTEDAYGKIKALDEWEGAVDV